MPNIRTIEGNFEYRMKEILSPLYDEWKEETENEKFDEWLWKHRPAELGRALIDDIETYCGFEDIELN
jgi:hypothetical protein